MAYNTKSIVKDVNTKPVPQYYNPTSDVYEVLQGENGANRVTLYTDAGAVIDLTTLIATIVTAINTTGTTQLRTGTNDIGKVEVTSNALPTGGSTLAKQDLIIAEIAKPVKLNGSTMEYFGKSTDVKPTVDIIKGSTYFEIDTTDVYMYDGTIWVVI